MKNSSRLLWKIEAKDSLSQSGTLSSAASSKTRPLNFSQEDFFYSEIRPLISPQVVGKRQPFPFLKNREIYAVVDLDSKGSGKIGIIPCNNGLFDRLIRLKTDSNRFMLVEELILHFVPQIFDQFSLQIQILTELFHHLIVNAAAELRPNGA